MRLRRLRTRLILAYTGLLVLGFGGLAWLAGGQIAQGAFEDFQQGLQSQVSLVARSMREDVEHLAEGERSPAQVAQRLANFAQELDARLVLVNPRGQVWLDSAGTLQPGSEINTPEVTTALRGRAGYDVREESPGAETAYAAAPMIEDGEVLGVIQLVTPAAATQATVGQRWLALGVGVVGLGLLALLASLWLAASLTRPLEQVRASALRVAEGDFSQRLPETRTDEIGEVATAFNYMAAQVEAMLDEQRAFASNASHELRTPLTTIRLRSEALRHDKVEGEAARQYIAEIDDEATRLSGLVEDLLLLSRLDAGRAERGTEQIDPLRLTRSLLREVEPLAQTAGVSLRLEAPDALPSLEASHNHLRVVLRNLLSNAINHTPAGGDVCVTLGAEDQTLLISVADTGEGIASRDLPRLFERFYRADQAHSRAVPGAGLGLPLVASVVQVYGGRISVESKGRGHGATASVWWPLAPDERNTLNGAVPD